MRGGWLTPRLARVFSNFFRLFCSKKQLLWNINIKYDKQPPEGVLTVETGICQIALFVFPLGKIAIVKRLFGVLNDERRDVILIGW